MNLLEAIEREASRCKLDRLTRASQELTQKYRESSSARMTTPEHRLAYAVARMPATFAAASRVFSEIPPMDLKSLLDLGAGPGTILWASQDLNPHWTKATLIEQDAEFIALGKRLLGTASPGVVWNQKNLKECSAFDPHDIVTLSYAIGELEIDTLTRLIPLVWEATQKICVIIEPGTVHGFERIRFVRQELINLGALIVAPCPHRNLCPMPRGDWCHFSQRLNRSFQHRYVKEATLNYEDEKYSYVIASRYPVEPYRARILRHPMKHSGHINLELCTRDGLKKETISRKQGELYKQARDFEWGDRL